jgi:hypothetical protein
LVEEVEAAQSIATGAVTESEEQADFQSEYDWRRLIDFDALAEEGRWSGPADLRLFDVGQPNRLIRINQGQPALCYGRLSVGEPP